MLQIKRYKKRQINKNQPKKKGKRKKNKNKRIESLTEM